MKNRGLLLAISLCLAFFFLGIFSEEGFNWKNLQYGGNAITTDELAHIPSGYYYLKTGEYFLNVEHPPLVKDLSALPLLFLNPVFPEISSEIIPEGYAWEHFPPKEFIFSKNLEISNDQWDFARVFLFNPQNDPELIALLARLSVLFFNALFLLLLYLLLSKNWNKRVAIISLILIVFSQFNIANGSLVITDFMSSILQMSAIISFSIYIKRIASGDRGISFFMLSFLFISLALLSKFSSAILIPALFIGGLICVILAKRNWKIFFQYVLKFSMLSVIVVLFISAFYYFHTFNMDNNDMIAQLDHYYPNESPFGTKKLMEIMIYGNPMLKGLAQFANGILMVFLRMSVVYQRIFFMGKVYGSEGAGLMYFPVLYLTKLPVGLLVLNAVGVVLAAGKVVFSKEKIKLFTRNPAVILLTLFIFFYLAATFSSDLQIGLRHIMPVILGITILTAVVMNHFWESKLFNIKLNYVFLAMFFAMGLSVLFSFPNYISYYNCFAGGSDKGYMIATDSNFDWGQDSKKLAKYVKDNGIKEIYIDIEGNIPFHWYLGDAYKVFSSEKDDIPPSGSYLAISISRYEIYNDKFKYLENDIIEKVGKTILVFKVP